MYDNIDVFNFLNNEEKIIMPKNFNSIFIALKHGSVKIINQLIKVIGHKY